MIFSLAESTEHQEKKGFRIQEPGLRKVAEIHKWIKTAQRDVDIYFYRTRSGLELDVLLQTRNGIIGMEIKARTSVSPTDYKAMIDIANRSGHEWLGGMIVYQGDSLKRIAEASPGSQFLLRDSCFLVPRTTSLKPF